jgi:hypothetical protein
MDDRRKAHRALKVGKRSEVPNGWRLKKRAKPSTYTTEFGCAILLYHEVKGNEIARIIIDQHPIPVLAVPMTPSRSACLEQVTNWLRR